MAEVNGKAPEIPRPAGLPAVAIYWDADKQTVTIHTDPRQVKHWSMAIMLLEAAQKVAEDERKFIVAQKQMAAMAHQQQEQMLNQAIAAQISNPHKIIHGRS